MRICKLQCARQPIKKEVKGHLNQILKKLIYGKVVANWQPLLPVLFTFNISTVSLKMNMKFLTLHEIQGKQQYIINSFTAVI